MATLHHVCDNCDSQFTIKYDIEKTNPKDIESQKIFKTFKATLK
jgi:hypothetical protein